jgi:Uma2 family endonuclease
MTKGTPTRDTGRQVASDVEVTVPPVPPTLRLGPADSGRLLDEDAFVLADMEPGWKYELVAGRLDVSPLPEIPEWFWEEALLDLLKRYSHDHPDVVGVATNKARVITTEYGGASNVEPDLSVFRERFTRKVRWREVSPFLVVEVVTDSHPQKDLVRNRALYAVIPSIQEYWIIDPRRDNDRPIWTVLSRGPAGEWREQLVTGPYTTALLPGLVLDLTQLRLGGEQA